MSVVWAFALLVRFLFRILSTVVLNFVWLLHTLRSCTR